ncbi:MAG: hypothetical protein WCD77_10810 [Acidobacteriaceae bacterium]
MLAGCPLHAQKRLLAYYAHDSKNEGFVYNASNIPYGVLSRRIT